MDSGPLKANGLEFQEAGDEVLVHDPNTGKIHILNRSAAKVLELCNGGSSDRLVEALMPAGPFQRERVERDVSALLENFARLGLIQGSA